MKKQSCLLLAAGMILPVFADPVLKVGTFQSKGASLEQPSLVEGNKRVGLRELYGSMFAGQDFKIGVYAGKEEICRIYFLGKFRGSWGFPFKTIPGKEKIAIDRRKSTISYCKEYQLPDKRLAQFRFTLAPEGPGRVRLSWDPGIPEKELSNIPNFELKPVVELPLRYREGGFRLAEQQKIQGCIFRAITSEDYAKIRRLPIVCCGMSSMRIPGATTFLNENLVRRSLEALRLSSCRTFGVIAPFSMDETKRCFPERLFRLAPDYGLSIREEWKYSPDRIPGISPVLDMKAFGCHAMERFRALKERPDGLLVFSDDLVGGITLALYRHGIRIPEDIRLVIHRTVESREICPFPCIFVESSIAEMAEMFVRNLQMLYAGKKIPSSLLGCEIRRYDL